jgi:hypothetical protein
MRVKYPLKISPNKRYLVDQEDSPFFLQGEAPWSLIVGVTKEDAEMYLANRSKKRFNAILVNLIEHAFCENPPKNIYGEDPFTTPGDFTTPNEKYFQHADWVISKAAEYNIAVLLCPMFLGVPGSDHGWYDEIVAQSPAQCLEYGTFLGKRYSKFDNILWSIAADRNPDANGMQRIDLISLGIKEYDSRHLMTAQCYPESSSVDIFSGGGWLDFNATYSYGIVHRKLLADYNHTPTMPTFFIESTYESEHNSPEVQIRRQAYWAPLCGGFGHVFGNFFIWSFGGEFVNDAGWPPGFREPWQQSMEKSGTTGMVHWGDLFRSRKWYDLLPDQKHEVVISGLGEFRGLDYLGAALTSDGRTFIAYMPTPRPITVDLSKMKSSKVRAWWFDPRRGNATQAGEFPTSGPKEFSPPGAGDWAFVLDDASLGLPAPGTTS